MERNFKRDLKQNLLDLCKEVRYLDGRARYDCRGIWTATKLSIQIRQGLRRHRELMAVLNHPSPLNFRGLVYPKDYVASQFEKRGSLLVPQIYDKTLAGLISLGFEIEERPPETNLLLEVLSWDPLTFIYYTEYYPERPKFFGGIRTA